ncbi:esterase E4 isoform X3 [Cephus cinctus]|uniref:Carboxylic ester hydrolase n=1 Tax=Cephus cinctus TaxID=211228 RepID=A0AAJ7FL22_CEPCN|nr:esterase E4 isoform X3 [Cephus cinctus]
MLRLSIKITTYLSFLQCCCYANPSVTIYQGRLAGIYTVTHNDRIVYSFLGIPYAEPPIGNLRFKAPQPPKPWTGTYRAENGSISCIQIQNEKIVGVEDCLYLNVYTPQLPEDSSVLLPVMAAIYGGNFKNGSASPDFYGPQYILDHNVVLVTMNYRLGVFGFMSTGDEASPGNYGLKDQTMALRWVQRNIGAFGGDADQVTLIGFSSGATSAHLLSLSDKTKGLFHKLILHSGTATCLHGYRDKSLAAKTTHEIAEFFDCPTENSTLIVRCLRKLKASTLASWKMLYLGILFFPTNEPESDEAIVTDSPANLMNQGKMRDLPWICGNVRDEGAFKMSLEYTNLTKFEESVSRLNDTIKKDIEQLGRNDTADLFEAVTAYYFNDWTVDHATVIKNYTDMFGDLSFFYPTIEWLETQARSGNQAGYMYVFEYRGTFSSSYEKTGSERNMGVWHGDDLIYLFPCANSSLAAHKKNMSRTDLKMMKQLTGLWTSFVTHGVPTLPEWGSTERWWKYDARGSYLRIGSNSDLSLIMKTSLHENRMNFWRKLLGQRISGSEDASAGTLTTVMAGYVILSYGYTS